VIFTELERLAKQCSGSIRIRASSTPTERTTTAAALQNVRRYWNDTFGVRPPSARATDPTEIELYGGVGLNSAVPDSTLRPD